MFTVNSFLSMELSHMALYLQMNLLTDTAVQNRQIRMNDVLGLDSAVVRLYWAGTP